MLDVNAAGGDEPGVGRKSPQAWKIAARRPSRAEAPQLRKRQLRRARQKLSFGLPETTNASDILP